MCSKSSCIDQTYPKLISTLKIFLRIDLHISNYARHLLTVARFLAFHFATKPDFSLKKPVTISLRRSLAPSLAQQQISPQTAVPGV
jgi:hypothetical protein